MERFHLRRVNYEIISFAFGYCKIRDKFGSCMSPSPLAMRDINLNIMLLNQNCSWDYFPIYSLILSIKHLHIIRF